MGEYLDELLMKNGIVSYNPECIRKKSNFSKSSKNFKFDSDTFDPEELLNNIRLVNCKPDFGLQPL